MKKLLIALAIVCVSVVAVLASHLNTQYAVWESDNGYETTPSYITYNAEDTAIIALVIDGSNATARIPEIEAITQEQIDAYNADTAYAANLAVDVEALVLALAANGVSITITEVKDQRTNTTTRMGQ
jgi:hypothetical protein